MVIKEIMNSVTDFFNEHVAPVHKITSVELTEDEGWKLQVEVIEEKEYMKKYAKDEMLGTYDVILNKEKEVTSFKRRDIRYRSAIGQEM
ncbi:MULTISPECIES: gas vesicle protein GvpO [Bacillaceae]|jgi:Gas vesicle synthesis protein GvpO|uniref:gas vesicle protein GvpO n=1 Tax=Bacillaceae TaxID=186817 RepID=UPI000BF89B75|nr:MULTISPECIES: gas vesicle protein GvpO [Bacillaceae]MCA0151398.1 gas vesicle protein [Rossellomorea vietnamensis]PFG04226.1 gas vesicle protein GvpO [Bacillus sp. es.034]